MKIEPIGPEGANRVPRVLFTRQNAFLLEDIFFDSVYSNYLHC